MLQGACQVARDGDESLELRRGAAASIMGGHGGRYDVHNRGANALQLFVAAVVAPRSDAQSRFATQAFDPEALGLVWIAAPASGEPESGPIPLHSTTRLGVASLAPGGEIKFSSALEHRLYVNFLLGNIEPNTGFLERGRDAKVSLEARGARIQGVTHARVVIADVPMAFVQELA